MSPRLSVVTATYNRAAHVRKMIDSALAQSRVPDEIVVSDDCSRDDTPSMLDALAAAQPLIRVIHQPRNSGGVMNWNHAVNGATGDLIAWCSDDDRFAPGHLEACEAYLNANPDVAMVHSGFHNAWENERGEITIETPPLFFQKPHAVQGAQIVRYMVTHYVWPFHPSTLVFRRRLWESIGEFDARYQLADTDWFIRAVMRHKVVYLPRYGAINRRHMNNWSIRTGAVRMHAEVDEAMRGALASLRAGTLERFQLVARWSFFHQYRMARLFLARARAGRLTIAQDIARSMLRSSGRIGAVLPEEAVTWFAGKAATAIRRVQEQFPAGVRRYEERSKWEPQ